MKKLYGEAFGYEPGPDGSTWRNGAIIFAAQQAFVEGDGNAALVRSEGLSFEPDAIHFDAAGLVEMGRRLAIAMAEQARRDSP